MKFAPIPFDWMKHTAGVVRQGVSRDTLLARSLIDLRHGDRRDLISPVQGLLLCMNTVLAVEDATHGLGRARVGAFYPAVGLRMALGCSTLEGAIAALARLYRSASNAVRIELATERDSAILSVRLDAADEGDAAYLEENYLLWMFQNCSYVLGRAPPVHDVTLRDPFHVSLGLPHWGIGGLVRHAEVTSFRFPKVLLGEAPRSRAGANVLWECQEIWLDFLDRDAPAPASAAYVAGDRFVRFADMVRTSGTSANTLRRRFRASNGPFREARERALVETATMRLTASDESVEAVAVELGYSDGRSFRRFLKNATGLTPQQIRDRRRAEETQVDLRALDALKAICGAMGI